MMASDTPSHTVADFRRLIQAGAPQLVADLARLVRIPSVSWEGFDTSALEASATAVCELMSATELFDSVGVYRHGGGAPAVIARREPAAGAPTVVLYAHHDVQPPGAEEEWNTPAYQPVVAGNRLYGRGSADDKAGIAVHLGALRALAAHEGTELSLGIVVFIEGEEENGSPSFDGFLQEYRALLAGDVIVVADSDNPAADRPAITTSLRGNVTATLSVATLSNAVHSGMFGGVLPDAMAAFVTLAASLYEPDGSVAIEGLHRDSAPREPDSSGDVWPLLPGVTQLGRGPVSERLWRAPAVTITGIDAPPVSQASNTLLPRISAKLSLRVAPGQSAAHALAALERHIQRYTPFGAHVELKDVSLGEPFLMSDGALAVSLAAAALEQGFGSPAIFQGVGGSIPFISLLATQFPGAAIVVTGVEDPLTNAHSPNESLHLGVLWSQVLSETIFLSELNRRKVSDF